MATCLRDFFAGGADAVDAAGACGFGLAAAAAEAGAGLVPGSGFMMLTGGIDAAVGKSMLTILRGPGPPGWYVGWLCGAASATGAGLSGCCAQAVK